MEMVTTRVLCDKCGHAACWLVQKGEKELTFCNHHLMQYSGDLNDGGWELRDVSDNS